MNEQEIKNHIAKRIIEKKKLISFIDFVEGLEVSKETLKEVKAKASSRIAFCDISIRDHNKLLTTPIEINNL
jgi:hypothetical protein